MFARLTSNYARLAASFLIGIFLIRVLIPMVGDSALGLILLIGSAVGIAQMVQEVVRTSIVRELGVAYHDDDPSAISVSVSSAFAVTGGAAILSLLAFAVLWLVTPLLRIEADLVGAARWLVVAKALECVVVVVLSPLPAMYVVTERMVQRNLWLVLGRASYLAAALITLHLLTPDSPASAVMWYGFLSFGLMSLMLLGASVIILLLDPRLWPRASLVRRGHCIDIMRLGGLNVVVMTAMNLHLRVDAILMNLFFGLELNRVFGLAANLAGYVQMTTVGVTDGLEAVTMRTVKSGQRATLTLMQISTRLQAVVALPAAAALFIFAEGAFQVWVGSRLANPETDIPRATLIIRVLIIGFAARGISDGWIRMLYGGGFIRRYAPLILIAGLLNPVVAMTLFLTIPQESPWRIAGPALSFAGLTLGAHFLLIPRVVSRCFEASYASLLLPVVRPAIATALAAPVALLAVPGEWTLATLLKGLAVSGTAFAATAWLIGLSAAERDRFTGRLRSLGRRPNSG